MRSHQTSPDCRDKLRPRLPRRASKRDIDSAEGRIIRTCLTYGANYKSPGMREEFAHFPKRPQYVLAEVFPGLPSIARPHVDDHDIWVQPGTLSEFYRLCD